tara:strand:- start:128 stop:574 length:447 start_codon:yes stop_codon:yes gene_type:complete
MVAVLQRSLKAEVRIDKKIVGKIQKGLVILLGIKQGDDKDDVEYLVKKILNIRMFEDSNGKMNLSIKDINASVLVVSQFTLCANINKGRRPSFIDAESPLKSKKLYDYFLMALKKMNISVEAGRFGADMNLELINYGPATFIINSQAS